MYEFEARLPVDHVLAAVRLIRSDNFSTSELLQLIGASVGEIGALLSKGPIFGTVDADFAPGWADMPNAAEKAQLAIEGLEGLETSLLSDPQFDPTPWIPVILALIEWLIRRRQG